MGSLSDLTIHELHDLLKSKKTSASEILDSVLARIGKVEERIGAFVTITEDRARTQAKAAEEQIRKGGPIPPLCGIPLGIKDNFLTRGIPTTCASKILAGYLPPYESSATERFLGQGAVLVGKLNLDEFAMGSSTENSGVKVTRNPWDLDRIPGGSSGGSAAAVAAGECIAATGTDTGGSIRLPAALCGLVGVKPTYGRVSRYGIVAFASSLDQVGPIARDVTDAAILLKVLAGHDPRDSTSLNVPVPDYVDALRRDGIRGLKLGVPQEYLVSGIDPEVERAFRQAVKTLEGLGARCKEVSLPHTKYGVPTYYILATAEASANLARYDGIRYGHRAKGAANLNQLYKKSRTEGFGPEVKRRIMLGTYVLSAGYYDAYYLKAQKVRTLIRRDFEKVFESSDAIVCPVSPTAAWKIGEKVDDPLKMYLSDIFTITLNLAGLPGMSLPCGFTKGNLPIGLQVIAPHLQEERMLSIAYAYEQATEWHRRRPPLKSR